MFNDTNTHYLSEDEINWEVTERLREEEKYVAFNRWVVENGIVCPTVY